MITRSGSGRGKNSLRKHTNHGDGADPSSALSITIHRMDNDAFSSKPDPIKDIYYAPYHPNQVAVDSFIIDNCLFIFQFTIASVHDIKKGILTFFSQKSLPLRSRENCYFIFVIPPVLSELSCPQPRDPTLKTFLKKIQLCSVVVDPQLQPSYGLLFMYSFCVYSTFL
jgi:hypothetical protein